MTMNFKCCDKSDDTTESELEERFWSELGLRVTTAGQDELESQHLDPGPASGTTMTSTVTAFDSEHTQAASNLGPNHGHGIQVPMTVSLGPGQTHWPTRQQPHHHATISTGHAPLVAGGSGNL